MSGKFYSNLHNSGGGIKYDLCNVYKSLLTALIIAIMALAIIPVRAFAEPIELTDSNGITYTLTENDGSDTYTLTVSGSGDMQDDDYKNTKRPFAHADKITKIVIEQGVTSIGEYAFRGCSTVTSVDIPSSVTAIKKYAFYRCSSLASIAIPEGVTSIGNYAFQYCSSLSSVTFPTTLNSIGYSAFSWCDSLTAVTIPGGVETIDGSAFNYCSSLTSVTISEGVKAIDPSVFLWCDNLTSVTLPSTLTFIGDQAFTMCKSLTEITIPESVTDIGGMAFFGCTSLDTIIYPANAVLGVAPTGEPAIPDNATQIKYEVIGGEVIITDIILGTEKDKAEVPNTVKGYPVAEVAKSVRDKVSESGHTHKGGTATCSQKAVCTLCGNEYGDFAAHNYVGGECTVCNTPDPNAGTTVTEPTVTDPTGSGSAGTDPTGTEPTGSSPTGSSPAATVPPTPSRPSAPSYPSSPSVTTAAAETTTVTVTTAEEIIADDTYTGEDVSVDAGIYEDNRDISERSAGLIILAIAAVIVCAVIIKKVVF